MNLKKVITYNTGLGIVAITLLVATPAFAESDTNASTTRWNGPRTNMMGGMRTRGTLPNEKGQMMMKPAIIGSVTAVSGNTITITGRQTPGNNGTSTFSVDATNAVVFKNKATSTVSGITAGDMVFIQGTVNGTNVTATTIRDNIQGVGFGGGPRGMEDKGERGPRNGSSTLPAMVGNGQPLVAGKVTAISGNTVTITTGNNVTYTVDATSAKVMLGKNVGSLSDVTVGSEVIVQGAVTGTSVSASTIIERPQPPAGSQVGGNNENNQQNQNENNDNSSQKPPQGFFGRVGGFFSHLFGF